MLRLLFLLFCFIPLQASEVTKVVFIGDSTVANTYGWGNAFSRLLKPHVICVNLAKNGRSSKSYRSEGWWEKALAEKPQWIFIQFGHNDQPGKGAERETNPENTYPENLLRYCEEAKAAGATPILVTSVTRRIFDSNHKINSSLTPYADAVKKLAKENDIICLDLHTRSLEEIEKIGPAAAADYNPGIDQRTKKPDTTHLSPFGEVTTAALVAREIQANAPAFLPLMLDHAAASAIDAVVAADGSGQYKSVNEAIAKADGSRASGQGKRWVIYIKNGTYNERIYVQRERGHIHLIGQDKDKTIITHNLHANVTGIDGKPIGTFATSTMQIDGDGMILENLTIANTAGRVGQAIALRCDGDRIALKACRLQGNQDTLLVNRGRHYFQDCFISGDCDFIFGAATAYFQNCTIHCLNDGYITAASTPENANHGFIFHTCNITAESGVKMYLGRPWRDFARTVFMHCEMPAAIRPEGWHNWNKVDAEKTAFYAEYQNRGEGADASKRVPWSKQLSDADVSHMDSFHVLSMDDHWLPLMK